MLINDFYHISYCTNIHPGQDWQTTFDSLQEYLPLIKKSVAGDKPFGLGLRLSNRASEELGLGEKLRGFKHWLDEQGLYVFTMNGFPYGAFHNEPVKDQVHAPDWTTRERLEYTRRLFDQLAILLPEGQHGGISTSPLSYKHWHKGSEKKEAVYRKGAMQMAEVIAHLSRMERDQGIYLHLDIEPEPDGMLENSDEVITFFKTYLEPVSVPYLRKELHLSAEEARQLVYRHITLCYDICHFSLAYEDPAASFAKFREAGIRIGKIQVSSALKVLFGQGDNEKLWESLSRFEEPVYLHQVTVHREGEVHTYSDLPEVLSAKNVSTELRAHFHVPIFLDGFSGLYSTQDQILGVLDYLKSHSICDQLEIETYTWEVLPDALKKPLSESIIRELEWLKQQLVHE